MITIYPSIYSFRGHQNNAALQVKTCVNAGMAKLVNLGAGLDLARGERCEDVKKGCIKKQETRFNLYGTNVIIGGDLCAGCVNGEDAGFLAPCSNLLVYRPGSSV